MLDPGHGGSDPGAVAFGVQEKDLNLSLAKLIAAKYPMPMTRTEDTYLPPKARCQFIRDAKPKMCLSIHHNAFDGKARGAEVIHSIHSDGKLAHMIAEELAKIIPIRRVFSRANTFGEDYYFIIRGTEPVETVIIELGFLDHEKDYALVIDPVWQNDAAEGIVDALRGYLGVEAWKAQGLKYLESKGYVTPGRWAAEDIPDMGTLGAILQKRDYALIDRIEKALKG